MELDPAAPQSRYSTLLELVQRLTSELRDEREVVERVVELVSSGRVVLTGSFRGCRLEIAPRPEGARRAAAARRARCGEGSAAP